MSLLATVLSAAGGMAVIPTMSLLVGAIPLTALLREPSFHEPLKKVGIVSGVLTIAITVLTLCIII